MAQGLLPGWWQQVPPLSALPVVGPPTVGKMQFVSASFDDDGVLSIVAFGLLLASVFSLPNHFRVFLCAALIPQI